MEIVDVGVKVIAGVVLTSGLLWPFLEVPKPGPVADVGEAVVQGPQPAPPGNDRDRCEECDEEDDDQNDDRKKGRGKEKDRGR